MKIFKHIVCLFAIVLLVSCSNKNDDLLKIIPADAAGVVCIDFPQVIEKGTLVDDNGNIKLPDELVKVIDGNDDAPLCKLLVDLPVMGIDTDCKVYAFVSLKTFGSVVLFALDDEDAAKKTVEMRTGGDFQDVDGLKCLYVQDDFYAISDGVLFIGRVNKSQEISKLASVAKSMLSRNAANITSNSEVMNCINADNDINVFIQLDGVKLLAKRSKSYQELSSKMPLLDIFTESDVQAYIASLNFNDANADLNIEVKVDDNSEYIKLLTTTFSSPSDDFLKVIPESMDYIMSMSVKGENFVKLQQIGQLISTFKKIPYFGKLDLEGMLSTIDGPVAVGMAHDTNLDDWNAVIAAKSTNPDAIVSHISAFASAFGQQPEVYEGEYIYEYDNKMIKLGVKDGILYIKMLNYDQAEGDAYAYNDARELFAKTPMGIYTRSNSNVGGSFNVGMVDNKHIAGSFTPSGKDANPVIALLQVMCGIKSASAFDNVDDTFGAGAIDALTPVP